MKLNRAVAGMRARRIWGTVSYAARQRENELKKNKEETDVERRHAFAVRSVLLEQSGHDVHRGTEELREQDEQHAFTLQPHLMRPLQPSGRFAGGFRAGIVFMALAGAAGGVFGGV
ncbi:hypothetical protein TRV_04329 [Trichophyton verrucosum HKI 0517]|uniref:Uncharacterized protein n=1 Tax=Trichophyton verrucosum (strain HKI 0517) TaxID=663202 RepID=D4DB30_TRIVH|nr:uncharacterized protein TRV_04329 [Trichophyton verrucosum HKI 0517]EFE40864.1 hypothetical protein TRV_04329 [Trichophyton verrucosum HKI 0517]